MKVLTSARALVGADESKRIFCVDLLRGLDIFFLLAVSYILLWQGVLNVWPLESAWAKVFWDHSLTAFAASGSVPTGFGIQDFTQPIFNSVVRVAILIWALHVWRRLRRKGAQ